MSARASGFTLVELAIVLVIVGLILGGMLRAQELVYGARVKNLANDFRVIPAAIYAYHDRFHAIPGDDRNATGHVPGASSASGSGVGNGTIDSAWNSTASTDESRLFWQHLRLANLVSGPADLSDPLYTPRNAMGGIVGVSSVMPAQLQIAGMTGDYQVCSSAVPGRFAKQLDATLDDAQTERGSVRAVPDGAPMRSPAVATTAVDDAATYTVCMTF